MGIPAAAFDIEGVDQLIRHDETGLLADFGDVDRLRGHCEQLLVDRKLSARLADAGQEFVRTEFSGERMAEAYTLLYGEITDSRPMRTS